MFKELLKLKILIVDDDSITQKLLKGLLEKQGHGNILIANSGEHALDLITNNPPDLILLDIFMPGIEGYGVCRRLKAYTVTAHILPGNINKLLNKG